MEALSPHCPFCGAKLPDDEGHARLVVVRCASCKELIDVPGRSRALEARQEYAAPAHFEVHDHQHEGLEVSWSWYDGNNGQYLPAAVGSGAMIFVFALLAVFARTVLPLESLPVFLFPLSTGLWSVGHLVNRTRLEVSRRGLKIRHGPFPLRGNVELPRDELAKLFVASPPNDFFNRSRGCSLIAIDRLGRRRELLAVKETGLATDADLLWLAQELKRQLGLED